MGAPPPGNYKNDKTIILQFQNSQWQIIFRRQENHASSAEKFPVSLFRAGATIFVTCALKDEICRVSNSSFRNVYIGREEVGQELQCRFLQINQDLRGPHVSHLGGAFITFSPTNSTSIYLKYRLSTFHNCHSFISVLWLSWSSSLDES